MIFKCIVVFDKKAETYELPQFVRATGEAIRIFQGLVNDGKSIFSRHPKDFLLFELGEFDERTGILVSHEDFKLLGSGDNYLLTKEEEVK